MVDRLPFKIDIDELVDRPWTWTLRQVENGWMARILELPGCFCMGITPEAALIELKRVLREWLTVFVSVRRGDISTLPTPLTPEQFTSVQRLAVSLIRS